MVALVPASDIEDGVEQADVEVNPSGEYDYWLLVAKSTSLIIMTHQADGQVVHMMGAERGSPPRLRCLTVLGGDCTDLHCDGATGIEGAQSHFWSEKR
ncbi:hypothetical protein VTI28DRAFT_1704 [Corynascus sepedonium]